MKTETVIHLYFFYSLLDQENCLTYDQKTINPYQVNKWSTNGWISECFDGGGSKVWTWVLFIKKKNKLKTIREEN